MNFDDDLRILRQQTGRFNNRFRIGPARWPHFDLLWIHQGSARLAVGSAAEKLILRAPDGVLIFPDVPFQGHVVDGNADASICHFVAQQPTAKMDGMGYMRPDETVRPHIQNLLRLSLAHAQNGVAMPTRLRLLYCILDCFDSERVSQPSNQVDRAWSLATSRLSLIRSLADVADLVGVSESAFRAQHRSWFGSSAGQYLREVRLSEAEQLLSSTGDSVSSISRQVGYGHPESFSQAFKASRGQTPLQYRRWSRRFA